MCVCVWLLCFFFVFCVFFLLFWCFVKFWGLGLGKISSLMELTLCTLHVWGFWGFVVNPENLKNLETGLGTISPGHYSGLGLLGFPPFGLLL